MMRLYDAIAAVVLVPLAVATQATSDLAERRSGLRWFATGVAFASFGIVGNVLVLIGVAVLFGYAVLFANLFGHFYWTDLVLGAIVTLAHFKSWRCVAVYILLFVIVQWLF